MKQGQVVAVAGREDDGKPAELWLGVCKHKVKATDHRFPVQWLQQQAVGEGSETWTLTDLEDTVLRSFVIDEDVVVTWTRSRSSKRGPATCSIDHSELDGLRQHLERVSRTLDAPMKTFRFARAAPQSVSLTFSMDDAKAAMSVLGHHVACTKVCIAL